MYCTEATAATLVLRFMASAHVQRALWDSRKVHSFCFRVAAPMYRRRKPHITLMPYVQQGATALG